MNVLEELTEFEDRIDRAHVERRIEDWEARILSLYALITSWLPECWTSSINSTARLREPIMEKFGVPDRQLPQLSLFRNGAERVKLEPRNLWIIGSNGRVDLIGSVGHFVINDRSEFFEQPSWYIAALTTRFDEIPLTAESFRRVLL